MKLYWHQIQISNFLFPLCLLITVHSTPPKTESAFTDQAKLNWRRILQERLRELYFKSSVHYLFWNKCKVLSSKVHHKSVILIKGLKFESSAFAFVCLEISNLLKLEISTLVKLENSCLLLFSEGLKFQALEGLKSNAKADDSNFRRSNFSHVLI